MIRRSGIFSKPLSKVSEPLEQEQPVQGISYLFLILIC